MKDKIKNYSFRFEELSFHINRQFPGGAVHLSGDVKVGNIQTGKDRKNVRLIVRLDISSELVVAKASCSLQINFEKPLDNLVSTEEIVRLGADLAYPYLESLISDTSVKFNLPPLRHDESKFLKQFHRISQPDLEFHK